MDAGFGIDLRPVNDRNLGRKAASGVLRKDQGGCWSRPSPCPSNFRKNPYIGAADVACDGYWAASAPPFVPF